ncbi:hypothetical protein Q3G72_009130 [Acer saccharum]|nr:hypothetical protein Q3G72_009130 [Acer saccharum]
MIALFLLLELLLKHVIWIFLPVSSETVKHFVSDSLSSICIECMWAAGNTSFMSVQIQNLVDDTTCWDIRKHLLRSLVVCIGRSEGQFRTSLQGTPENELQFCIESGDARFYQEFFQSCQRKEILKCHWPLSNVKYTLSPIKEFGQNFLVAPIGLLDMYNSGGAVDTMNWIIELSECIIKIKCTGCGRFGAYSNIKPQRCMLDMKEEEFHLC